MKRSPRPWTRAHFKDWCSRLILDNGEPWEVEPFQLDVVDELHAGAREVWLLVPEGNGKTTLMAGVALYHGAHQYRPAVPVAASSREQAEILYRQAEGIVLGTAIAENGWPEIRELFKCQEGYRRIKCLKTIGRIQIYAADDRTADGVIYTLAILDELHRHRDLRLYRTWRGKADKRGGQIIGISTAGEPGSDFEETRGRILREAHTKTVKGAHIRAVAGLDDSGEVVLHDWAVRDRSQVSDMKVVAAANPRTEITEDKLRHKFASPTTDDAHWQRFTCNIATRVDGQGVTPEEWDKLREDGLEPDLASWSIGWLDLGWKIDTTAMGVLVWESSERRLICGVKVLPPPVDESDVVAGLLERQADFGPVGWVYDPNAGGQQMVQLLEKGEHPLQRQEGAPPLEFIEHSQDNAPMSQAAARLDEAVRNGWFRHDGNSELRKHVLNAVRVELGAGKHKYDRPKDAKGEKRRKYPIDCLTGVLMGNNVAVDEKGEESVPLIAWGAR